MSKTEKTGGAQRALLLVNRGSRDGAENARRAARLLRDRGVDVFEADCADPDTTRATVADHAERVDTVVVGGGDGSISMLAGALMEHGPTLAILPLGTANDLARTLCIPTKLEAACAVAVDGVEHAIDVAQCNDIYYVNVASLGLPVRAHRYRSNAAKRWLGAIGYAGNVGAAFRDTRPFDAQLVFSDHVHKTRAIQLVVGNGRNFGGGLAVARDAAPDDGRLDVYSLAPQSWWGIVAKMPTLVRGPEKSGAGMRLFHATELEIRTQEPVAINTDGEVLTETPAKFKVLRGALRVRVPQAYFDA